MLIDGRNLPHHATLRADVVVVGSGPAGITVAEELARSNRHVLLVEAAGRHHDRADDDALHGDSSGEPFPLQPSRHRGFGGTSTHWTPATGLRVRPLDTVDFAARPCRPNDAWPFGPAELEPFYRTAYRSIGLDPSNEPARWYGAESPTPLAWPGGPQLAMFQFAPHDSFTRRFDRVHNTPLIDLLLHSTVLRLEVDASGASVHRAAVVSADGGPFFVAATVFVLACGGIDNVRLLLNSPGASGCPIGNRHDNVGRYFMDHLSVDTGIIVPAGTSGLLPETFREQTATGGDRYQPMLWLGNDLIEREGIGNAAFWIEEVDPLYYSRGVGSARSLRATLKARPRRDVGRYVARAIGGSLSVLGYAARRITRAGPRVIGMRILAEQFPDRRSQIRLSPRRDALGMPRVDVDWRISGADIDVVVAHQELLGRLLAARGVARLTERFDPASHPAPIMSNYHHLGTTRMHHDPRRGVVDVDGRVHSTTNLYVTGGSVFPTGGYLNPTLTILALALRTARVVAERWRSITLTSAR